MQEKAGYFGRELTDREAASHMHASQTTSELILVACPDRRSRGRIEHREPVQVDGRLVMSRDISSRGVSVVMQAPLAVGEAVCVTLAGATGHGEVVTRARVVHVKRRGSRTIAGLEFI